MKAWAIVDKDGINIYILFHYDNDGIPHLDIFDQKHKKFALQMKDKWKKASHPTAKLVECEIKI